jgi:hypothetical protein
MELKKSKEVKDKIKPEKIKTDKTTIIEEKATRSEQPDEKYEFAICLHM